MIGRELLPAGVRWYSQPPDDGSRRSMTPASSSSRRRRVSSVLDMRGTPRWRSLKRWLPQSSSRRTRGVQRSATTSEALATGQNWPYPTHAPL
jgi:hypothetical protein